MNIFVLIDKVWTILATNHDNICEKSLKTTKGQSELVNRRKTDNKMVKRKKTNNDLKTYT
jgi:hypothetical protein